MRTPDTLAASRYIGQRVRDRRTQLHLKQVEVAGPYTASYISALETGLCAPSLAALLHLSKVLKVQPAWFLKGLNYGGRA